MNEKEVVLEAEQLARKAHEGQKQATGKPYFEHPQEVARLLGLWGQDEEVICAGYLHDVVEDCNILLKEIKEKFGERVAKFVDGMSWVIDKGKKDFDITYKKFSKIAKNEPALVLIKLADMTANLPNIDEPSHREFIINKSYPRNMVFYIPLMKAVGLGKEADEIIKRFHKYINTPIDSVLYDYLSIEDINEIKSKILTLKR